MTPAPGSSWEDVQLAGRCALIYRFGLTRQDLAELPRWRRALGHLLPRRHRWRIHPLAGRIRDYNRGIPPASSGNV